MLQKKEMASAFLRLGETETRRNGETGASQVDYTDKKIDYNDILSDRDARYEMRDTKIANVGFRIAETNRRISGN
jgi:hypothetical protein